MSPFISPWVSLNTLNERFNDPEEWKQLVLEGLIRLRGRYCDDYTAETDEIKRLHTLINPEYILNGKIDIKNGRVTAGLRYSNDPFHDNYSLYEDVQASEDDFRKIRKAKLLTTRIGRPSRYKWGAIEQIFRRKAPSWPGSLNTFIDEYHDEFAALDSKGRAPERSVMVKKMGEVFKEVREP